MHVWVNTPVVACDGAGVGRVAALVVHPASWRILRIVVRHGRLWNSSEIELGLADVERATPMQTWLRMDSDTFRRRQPASTTDRRRPSRDWLTPFGWRPGQVYWPADYDGPVYFQVTPAQLKGWITLRSSTLGGAPPRDGPTVLAQDGREVGRAAQVVLDPVSCDVQSVRFEAHDGLWSERFAEVGAAWIAHHDKWHVWLIFDFQTLRTLIHSDQSPAARKAVAGGRLERELMRQLTGLSLYEIDPYDVLAQPSLMGFETAIERDEASIINPQPRP